MFQNLTKEAYEIKVPFEYIDHHLELMSALAKIHDTFIQESNIGTEDAEMMRMVLFLVFQKNMNMVEKKITEFNILFNL